MQRVKELDSIRGLAALCIVLYHLWAAWIGVLGSAIDLFFVLSGYLITSIILSHPPSGEFLFAFYARRGLRIWPVYYLSLFLLVAINPWTSRPGSLAGLPQYLTFTQFVPYYWSDAEPAFIPAFRHTWSLAVEEQFYLIWPALLLLLGRKGVRGAATAVILAAVVMRTLDFNRWVLATNCDGLALGALLAGLLHGRLPSEARGRYSCRFALVGLGAAAVWVGGALIMRFVPGGRTGDLTAMVSACRALALNLAFFALVGLTVLFADDRRLAFLRDRRLVYIGQISYGLYLYHHIVFMLLDDYTETHGLAGSVALDLAKVAASLAIAALSYRLVEMPMLSLKRLFPYRSTESAGVAGIPRGWKPLTVPEEG